MIKADDRLESLIKQYRIWSATVASLVKYAQDLTIDYALKTGEEVPADLDPAELITETWQTSKTNAAAISKLWRNVVKLRELINNVPSIPEPQPPQPPAGDDPVHPGGTIDIPSGKNPMEHLIGLAQANYPNPQLGDVIPIFLPKGEIKGIAIGGSGWSPLGRIAPWWGQAVLQLVGHPEGTEVQSVHDLDGWGATFTAEPHDGWDGRLHLFDITFRASGQYCISLGRFGSHTKVPLNDIFFKRCQFLDHKLSTVTPLWGVSAQQTALFFEECLWDLKNSTEHSVYGHHPHGKCGMLNCTVIGAGGQVWQEVSRPHEGVRYEYPAGTTSLIGNHFEGYHRAAGRSGSAITMGGSGRDWEIRDNFIVDTSEDDGVYGGLVSWDDGGRYYSITSGQSMDGVADKTGQYANGIIIIEDNIFVQKNPDRAILTINSAAHVECRRNGIFANNFIDIQNPDEEAEIGELIFEENNRPEDKVRAKAVGVTDDLLIDPQVRFKKQVVGTVTDTIRVQNGIIV